MKKSRFSSALLALTLITTAAPIAAKESAVKKRFNESLDRFKRCMKGKCTRGKALKAARDLGIAAAVVVGGMYATRKVLLPEINEFYTDNRGNMFEIKAIHPTLTGIYIETSSGELITLSEWRERGFTKKG